MTKKLFLLLLALAVTFGFCAAAFASQTLDLDKPGSITFQLGWEGEPLNGGTLTVYRVGIYEMTLTGYQYALLPELAEMGISLHDTASPETAQAIAKAVEELSLTGMTAPITDGTAAFTDLVPGLFLVVQQEPVPGFSAMAPFLISLPVPQGDGYVYDLVAEPKVSLEPEPTDPPPTTEPPDDPPDIPQTGQLNWPVPVLAIWGSLTLVFGLVLCFKRKGHK